MILPEADLAAAIPRRQFASLDAALKYFHHRLLAFTASCATAIPVRFSAR